MLFINMLLLFEPLPLHIWMYRISRSAAGIHPSQEGLSEEA